VSSIPPPRDTTLYCRSILFFSFKLCGCTAHPRTGPDRGGAPPTAEQHPALRLACQADRGEAAAACIGVLLRAS
jgi:hypothetical protein